MCIRDNRMGCLKGGVVANVVVPAPGYLAFASHYGFRPDFCEAADPESKGVVENLVGYAKADLMIPGGPFPDLAAALATARSGNGPPGIMRSALAYPTRFSTTPLLSGSAASQKSG